MKKYLGLISAFIIPIAFISNLLFQCPCIVTEETTVAEKLSYIGLNYTWPIYAIQFLLMIVALILWRTQTKISRIFAIITAIWLALFFSAVIL